MGLPVFRGLFPIVHTPFTEHGDVDFDSLRSLVRLVGGEADGMAFPGFASEFWRLTEAEILECAAAIVGAAPEGFPVVLNVTPQAVVPAVKRAVEFARMGAKSLMVLPAFQIPVPVAAVEEHLGAVLGATGLPCIVQDSAGLTGTQLPAGGLARLREEHVNFAALKVDQVPTGPAISALRAVPALSDLAFFVGYSGVQMLDAVRRGATGLMGGCGHLQEDRRMLDALLGGDAPAGYREFARLSPMLNFEMQTLDLSVSVHKRLLREAGVIATSVSRQPCRPMDDVHAGELALHMRALRG
ncbi:MAG: dihydrodipicolinate synthase family protein [Acidobacteria bacterium]|nr:dihydrodipicolinate synthase family protein [Acidobacteriota bacterium]